MNNNAENKKKITAKKTFNVIGNILITIYVLAVLVVSFSVFSSMATGYPNIFGNTLLYVRTDSMESDAEDAIFAGDLVVCHERTDYYGLEPGTIIAYDVKISQIDENGTQQIHNIVRVHRILSTNESGSGYITAGDNSPDYDGDGKPDPDAPVAVGKILGVYEGMRFPGVGKVFDFLQSQNGILVCLVIPMAAFFIFALYKFVKAFIEFKLEKANSGAPSADGELTEEQKQAAIAEYLAKQAAEANKDENNTDSKS